MQNDPIQISNSNFDCKMQSCWRDAHDWPAHRPIARITPRILIKYLTSWWLWSLKYGKMVIFLLADWARQFYRSLRRGYAVREKKFTTKEAYLYLFRSIAPSARIFNSVDNGTMLQRTRYFAIWKFLLTRILKKIQILYN